MLKRLKSKLKEEKGVSVTLENLIYMMIVSVLIIAIISIFGVLYTEYKLNNFVSELVRTAELSGEVGASTSKREKELQEALAVKPRVTWSKQGRIKLNETIKVTCKLDYNIKIPFWDTVFKLERSATGRSEVYWK